MGDGNGRLGKAWAAWRRYRRAAEAHRAGASGGAVGSAAAAGSALPVGAIVTPIGPGITGQPMIFGAPGFDGIDFAPGVLRGVRSWRARPDSFVGQEGLLEGMFFRQPWYPGENRALCLRQRNPSSLNATPPGSLDGYHEPELGHLPNCKCGFYAYYDGSNDYYTGDKRFDSLVTGVVEGYGEVLVGRRGFRCTKARIVALMLEPSVPMHERVLERYNVPVFHDFDMMIRAFPEEDGGARDLAPRLEDLLDD